MSSALNLDNNANLHRDAVFLNQLGFINSNRELNKALKTGALIEVKDNG